MGWLRRVLEAVGMGITRALIWAPAGVGIGLVSLVAPSILADRRDVAAPQPVEQL